MVYIHLIKVHSNEGMSHIVAKVLSYNKLTHLNKDDHALLSGSDAVYNGVSQSKLPLSHIIVFPEEQLAKMAIEILLTQSDKKANRF